MGMSFNLEIDTSQRGLRMVLKDWQEEAMKVLWGNPQKGQISREVFDQVNKRLNPGSISRASIINFLEDMVSMGVLNRTEITGKGGHRGVYSPKMDEPGFKKFVAKMAIEALMRNFPEETRQALEKLS
jgi:hypothetical protein